MSSRAGVMGTLGLVACLWACGHPAYDVWATNQSAGAVELQFEGGDPGNPDNPDYPIFRLDPGESGLLLSGPGEWRGRVAVLDADCRQVALLPVLGPIDTILINAEGGATVLNRSSQAGRGWTQLERIDDPRC